jgi:hypothetical protein
MSLYMDCEEITQQDWNEQAPAAAAYRREPRGDSGRLTALSTRRRHPLSLKADI